MNVSCSRRCVQTTRVAATALVGVLGLALAAFGGVDAAAGATSSVIWTSSTTYGSTDRTIDGDTVVVRVDGDTEDVPPPHVRNAGIQTMETGTCHAAAATASMKALTAGRRVRMTITNPAVSSLGRPVRHLDVESGSEWVDTQLSQLQNGHALPVVNGDSTRWRSYFTAAQEAARAGQNLWDSDACGAGPAQSTPLRVWAHWDGNGDDAANPNSEYLRVLNLSDRVLGIGGWIARTGGADAYLFPATARVPARGTLTLRVGTGTNTTTTFHWGSSAPKFANANLATNAYGNGAYLFDPDGDLRAWSIYPCLTACTDPLIGTVSMAVNPNAPGVDAENVNGEYVQLSPSGTIPVDLSYRVLSAHGYTYELPKGSVVEPGETLTVHLGRGYSSRLRQYWGNTRPVLGNAGGAVELRTPESVRIVCRAWGTGRC